MLYYYILDLKFYSAVAEQNVVAVVFGTQNLFDNNGRGL